jgi:catalase
MSDRGTPRTLRHMNGFGSHTFMWVNAGGQRFWVKYHFKTEQGVENFTDAEAKAMTAEDPDYHRADLWNAIEGGEYPEWRLEMQIMAFEDAADYRFNPFDLTKVWPHSDYPPISIGRMVLNRNPDNYFAQVEQAAFEPSNMVPGIAPSPDKMLQGRLFSYPDTHRYRIGPNYLQLPVNQPLVPVRSYSQDGPMNFRPGVDPVYAPNSYGGPQADPSHYADPAYELTGEIVRSAYKPHKDDTDFVQPGTMYREVMSETDQEHLLTNIIGHATHGPGLDPDVARRVGDYWRQVDPDLGANVAKALEHEA